MLTKLVGITRIFFLGIIDIQKTQSVRFGQFISELKDKKCYFWLCSCSCLYFESLKCLWVCSPAAAGKSNLDWSTWPWRALYIAAGDLLNGTDISLLFALFHCTTLSPCSAGVLLTAPLCFNYSSLCTRLSVGWTLVRFATEFVSSLTYVYLSRAGVCFGSLCRCTWITKLPKICDPHSLVALSYIVINCWPTNRGPGISLSRHFVMMQPHYISQNWVL